MIFWLVRFFNGDYWFSRGFRRIIGLVERWIGFRVDGTDIPRLGEIGGGHCSGLKVLD